MTITQLVEDVRAHLEGDYRPRLEILDNDVDDVEDVVSLSYNGVLTAGAVISIETEDMYVLDWDQGTRQAIVIRGHRGTTAAAHADGDVVEMQPRFSAAQIIRALRDELRGWSQSLYRVASDAVTIEAFAPVAEVPAAMAGLFGIVEATTVDFYRSSLGTPEIGQTTNVLYRQVPIVGVIRGFSSLGFTREAIRFGQIMPTDVTAYLVAGLPFEDLATDSSTLTSQGIETYMEEPLTLGAAARLLRPREAARTQRHGQGEPRRGEEVPPMHTRNAGADLGSLAREAFGRAARRLQALYPLRFT